MANAPTMTGLTLPDVDVWSERVTVALGQNPSAFTGPGTNTYILGTGARRILLDPGSGFDAYLPVLERAMERSGCEGFQEIVLTHGHPDHIGGVASVIERFGPLKVSKLPWPGVDEDYPVEITPIDEGAVVRTEGVTLRALHTPGHAPDHLCFEIEEEGALISGDNVLGVGTTVIPVETGDLADYMDSLTRMQGRCRGRIYPAHGPLIEDGPAKLREYLAHRQERERQVLTELARGPRPVMTIVKEVYAAYPEHLHAAAAQSVTQHLLKLERDGRAARSGDRRPVDDTWRPT